MYKIIEKLDVSEEEVLLNDEFLLLVEGIEENHVVVDEIKRLIKRSTNEK